AEAGIRDRNVTGVQTCALPICSLLGDIRTQRPCPTCHGFGSTITNPCAECSGEGRVRARRTITVNIPSGVDQGTRVQLSGQGEVDRKSVVWERQESAVEGGAWR